MTKILKPEDEGIRLEENAGQQTSRRSFLKWSSTAALAAFAFGALNPSSLKAEDAFLGLPVEGLQKSVDLGKGDFAVLNYAYALEQLEAAFYTQVVRTKYSGMNSAETQIFEEIRDHEIAHRELFKAVLGKKAIPGLEVNFTAIDFNSRDSVLGTAKTFEDLGVSAYNGAGQLLQNGDFLLLAGKIVSVEARHAATIRDLIQPKSSFFAGDDIVDPATGLDMAKMPSQVLPAAAPFVKTKIKAKNLLKMEKNVMKMMDKDKNKKMKDKGGK